MSNTDIYGMHEEMWGEIEGDRVLVHKTHFRSARDAAVPTGQAMEFEFHVARFPFTMIFTHGGDNIGTTAREVEGGGGRGRVREGTRVGSRAVGRAVAREGAAASERERGRAGARERVVSRSGERAGGVGGARVEGRIGRLDNVLPESSETGTSVIELRRPTRPFDPTGPLGDWEIGPIDPPPPPPDRELPFEITLTPPNGLAPLLFTRPKPSFVREWPSRDARIDPAYLERGRGKWHISVRNVDERAQRMDVLVGSIHAITPVSTQDIPLSLLNSISAVALQKAAPTIEYVDDRLLVSTPAPFLDLMGVGREYELPSVATKIIDDLPTFKPLWVKVMSRAQFLDRLRARKAEIVTAFDEAMSSVAGGAMENVIRGWRSPAERACDAAIAQVEGMTDSRAAYCLVMEGMFSDPGVDLRYVGTVAEIENRIPQIGLLFDEHLKFSGVVSNLAISLSPALTKIVAATAVGAAAATVLSGGILGGLVLLGGALLYNSVDDIDVEADMRLQIHERGATIAGYVKATLERITDLGAIALNARVVPSAAADGSDVLRIRYFNPSTARPPRPWRPIDDALGDISEVLEIGTGEVDGRPRGGLTLTVPERVGRARRTTRLGSTGLDGRITERLVPLTAEPPGPLPDDFVVPASETLARLDDHDCIVIVMMENRSYDHYFFELPDALPGRGYRKVPESYANPPPPGWGAPFRPIRNTTIGIGNNLIYLGNKRSLDPNHNYDHTEFQIGGGTAETKGTGEMRGFAADFAGESDAPQIVMSYLSLDDLPVYKALAGHYPVCDRWFAALPVGTYPNRLSSLQGNVPFLYNIHMDDPSLGYLEDYSVFDLLNNQGISWKFFESDIGTIRLYDRFRLDVRNVRPIDELDDTLFAASQGAPLPRVMFIEPQFLFGDDDHPPMGVDQGQAFLRQVIGKFIQHGMLDRVLFAITYDEHGGFFDHVAPPGTPVANGRRPTGAEVVGSYGAVEPLFPQDPDKAPKSLGVRVPSIVLSRWTSARANHTILDHTAILKTILLHNRDAISTEQFARFGERVKKRGHLGEVLDRATPRSIDYTSLMGAIGYQPQAWHETVAPAVVSARVVGMTPSHPANVLRGIGSPRPRVVRA